jgi:hypothetical protein
VKENAFERTLVLGETSSRDGTQDIHTRVDATISGHDASTQASYDDDLVEFQIPNIDPD